MLRIGLTGGIGAGKSTVARRLAELGAILVDADQISREVVASGSKGLADVIAEFGPSVVDGDGGLDRPALARVVFADSDARNRLNAIMHPLIGTRTREIIASAPPEAVVVQDIPLLVESQMAQEFPLVVVVDAPPEERVHRLVAVRGMPERDARARIASQADEPARRAVADVWLDNSGDQHRLRDTVDRMWRDRLVPFESALHRGAVPELPPILVEHDAGWAKDFARLSKRIAKAAQVPERDVRHIGSTSVPQLAARDVLDLQLSVVPAATGLAQRLLMVGFVPVPGQPIFRSADPARPLDLYLRTEGEAEWRLDLLLRDWLRSDPMARIGYLEVKRRAERGDGAANYAEVKGSWFDGARDCAERWADTAEWSTPELRRAADSGEVNQQKV